MLEVSQLGREFKMFVFLRHFYLFVCVLFFLDKPQVAFMKLYNIRVLLNHANCLNFQTVCRNLDITVSATSNHLFFYNLLIIFVRGKPESSLLM